MGAIDYDMEHTYTHKSDPTLRLHWSVGCTDERFLLFFFLLVGVASSKYGIKL